MTKESLITFSLFIFLSFWGCQIKKVKSPNVIIILTDDQGWVT